MADKNPYTKRVIILIVIFSILRLIVASTVELANDESYYWLYSQHLKWNYFDHPPMVAIWVRIFTANLLLEKYVVFLRLGSIVGCALSTWFMFKCVTEISNERAGWFAACLYNASFYAVVTAGLFIFPDSPQMVFYTFSLWMLAKISLKDNEWKTWILFGVGTGLCIMSKVHGAFIWIGLGLYVLFIRRSWLTNSKLYTALAIAFIISSPILIWNIKHDFLTYRFNSERIVIKGFGINAAGFVTAALKQFMVNNPLNVVIIISGLAAWRKQKLSFISALPIFSFIGISLALLLLFISLFRFTLPHWSGPAYIVLLPVASIWLSRISTKPAYPKLLVSALGINVFFLIGCTFFINYYPGTVGSKIKSELGKGDITLDMYGWNEAGKKFATFYKDEVKKGKISKGSPVVCNTWWGAHDEYYFCRAAGIPMIGLGGMNDLHEYMWMNKKRERKVDFSTAYSIIHSDENYDAYKAYDKFYNKIDTAGIIEVPRNGKLSHSFYILQLTGWKNHLPLAPD